MRQHAKFHQNRSNGCRDMAWQFNDFQNGDCPPSWIFEIQIFKLPWQLKDLFCTAMRDFVKIFKPLLRSPDFCDF